MCTVQLACFAGEGQCVHTLAVGTVPSYDCTPQYALCNCLHERQLQTQSVSLLISMSGVHTRITHCLLLMQIPHIRSAQGGDC
jgi:hypothetical protein